MPGQETQQTTTQQAATGAAGTQQQAPSTQTQEQPGQQVNKDATSKATGTQQQQVTDTAKPGEPAKDPAKPAAQAWDAIKLPEGTKPDKFVEGFTKLAKEKGWSQQQAQDAADWFFKTTADSKKASDDAYQKLIADDLATLKADPEFGGINFDKSNAAATSFITQFDDKDGSAAKLLELVGAKTAAPIVKLLARARAAIAEDKSPFPKTVTTGETGRLAELKAMFPNSPEMWTPK